MQTTSTCISCVPSRPSLFSSSLLSSSRTSASQVHLSYMSFSGITVGQAHLLDDLIDLLELDLEAGTAGGPAPLQALMARRTFTYALGTEHKLFGLIRAAEVEPETAVRR